MTLNEFLEYARREYMGVSAWQQVFILRAKLTGDAAEAYLKRGAYYYALTERVIAWLWEGTEAGDKAYKLAGKAYRLSQGQSWGETS